MKIHQEMEFLFKKLNTFGLKQNNILETKPNT